MKSVSLLAAGAIILVPAIAAASQPAQAPPSQGTTQAQASTAQPNEACDPAAKPAGKSTKAKSADSGGSAATSSESAMKVQRDTGDRPAPPKKSKPEDEATCPPQPQ
jgi:hypothetical protein